MLTLKQKIKLIDEYLEEPNNIHRDWLEMIREYRQMLIAEEQGLLVKLPCKAGDTIYRAGNGEIWEWQIAEVNIYPDELWLIDDSDNIFGVSDIGKTVFLTREEAEAALKEKEVDNG